MNHINRAALPSYELSRIQCDWLAGARSRLLRSAGIRNARHVLDLGCGWGIATVEFAQRCSGQITGIDILEPAIDFARSQLNSELSSRVSFLQADAKNVPLETSSMDIIFTQCSLMWIQDPRQVLSECRRLLAPGGRIVVIEPDYGGLMEWPSGISTRDIWLSVMTASGADPMLGRKLPVLLHEAGFEVNSYFFDRYEAPSHKFLDFLEELELNPKQRETVQRSRMQLLQQCVPQQVVVHLPFWLQVARKLDSPAG